MHKGVLEWLAMASMANCPCALLLLDAVTGSMPPHAHTHTHTRAHYSIRLAWIACLACSEVQDYIFGTCQAIIQNEAISLMTA